MWATDALFRSLLVADYSPLFIVWTSHVICLVVTANIVMRHRAQLSALGSRDWLIVTYVACAGGAVAMVCFTQAFATASNYTVPILIQKLQPVIALALAVLFLRERPHAKFFAFAAIALVGAYLVSFGLTIVDVSATDLEAILYALAAAAIWGSTTVAGRHLSGRLSPHVLTSLRYVIATVFLTLWCGITGDLAEVGAPAFAEDLFVFVPMALGPGLIALFIYYFGLRQSTAASATFAELAFPIGAIAVNWAFLDAELTGVQIIGAALLLGSVTLMSGSVDTAG